MMEILGNWNCSNSSDYTVNTLEALMGDQELSAKEMTKEARANKRRFETKEDENSHYRPGTF